MKNLDPAVLKQFRDYDSVNIAWGVLENYEVIRKIGEEFITCSQKTGSSSCSCEDI